MKAEKEGGLVGSEEVKSVGSVVTQANKSPSSPVASEMLPIRLNASKIFQLMPRVLIAERSKGEMIERKLKDSEGE
jgi:hypothetical protein